MKGAAIIFEYKRFGDHITNKKDLKIASELSANCAVKFGLDHEGNVGAVIVFGDVALKCIRMTSQFPHLIEVSFDNSIGNWDQIFTKTEMSLLLPVKNLVGLMINHRKLEVNAAKLIPRFDSLQFLRLFNCRLTDLHVNELRRISRLKSLTLGGNCSISAEAIQNLVRSTMSLESLYVDADMFEYLFFNFEPKYRGILRRFPR